MGPLFSAALAAVILAVYVLLSYVLLSLIRRRVAPLLDAVAIAIGGVIGAGVGLIGTAPFMAGRTIESTAGVVGYLAILSACAIIGSMGAVKFVARKKHEI
jgi:hypothetical protein